MVDTVEWPSNLRITDRTDPALEYFSRSGGISLSGQEQVISSLTSRWRFSFEVPILEKSAARSFRVVKHKARGRFNYFRVRICDHYRITRRDVLAVYDGVAIPHSDGALFSDDSGYALANPESSILNAYAAGVDTIEIDANPFSGAFSGGVFFSINGWLHLVEEWSLDAGAIEMKFSPPLRRPVVIGDTADFDAKFVGNLETDTMGELILKVGKFGGVQLTLVEDVGRAA